MWNWLLPDRPPNAAALEAARREAEQEAARRAALPNAGVVAAATSTAGGQQQQRQTFYGGGELTTATAVEVRRQKDAELRANDAHWTARLAQQELAQQRHSAVREREFNAAVSVCAIDVFVGVWVREP